MLRFLYIVAIGLLFAGFVGLGFAAFYPSPKYPECSRSLYTPAPEGLTEKQQLEQEKCEQEQKAFQEKSERYNRDLSIGIIVVSLVVLALSILGMGKIEVIGDGLTLGGVFTLFYGLGRAIAGGDEKVRFVAVTVGLAVILILSYWKFVKPARPQT